MISHKDFCYVDHIPYDIRYATSNNFVGRPIAGYLANKCVVSTALYAALSIAQKTANKKGLSLIIFEAYRPLKALEDILQWSKNTDTSTKERFYPNIEKTSLFELGYIALRSTHTRGAAIDVTLINSNTQKELDMGTEFDFFGELSHTASKNISAEANTNRRCLLEVMGLAGFVNYEKEWWHFTLKNEPFPNCYFDFDII